MRGISASAGARGLPEGGRGRCRGPTARPQLPSGHAHRVAWGDNGRGRAYLLFLSEHRLTSMRAVRYYTDGRTEVIPTPGSSRLVSSDPAEDARMEREFYERNRAAYAELRGLGLLPPEGDNVFSQEINEYLLAGGSSTDVSGPDATPTDIRADGVRLGGGWDDLLREDWHSRTGPTCSSTSPRSAPTMRCTHRGKTPSRRSTDALRRRQGRHYRRGPLHQPWAAHGLAFSVPVGAAIPPSLRNIRKELAADFDISPPTCRTTMIDRVGRAGRPPAQHRAHRPRRGSHVMPGWVGSDSPTPSSTPSARSVRGSCPAGRFPHGGRRG